MAVSATLSLGLSAENFHGAFAGFRCRVSPEICSGRSRFQVCERRRGAEGCGSDWSSGEKTRSMRIRVQGCPMRTTALFCIAKGQVGRNGEALIATLSPAFFSPVPKLFERRRNRFGRRTDEESSGMLQRRSGRGALRPCPLTPGRQHPTVPSSQVPVPGGGGNGRWLRAALWPVWRQNCPTPAFALPALQPRL